MKPEQQAQINAYCQRVAINGINRITPFAKAGRFYINIQVTTPEPKRLQPSFADAELRDYCVKELEKCKNASRVTSTP